LDAGALLAEHGVAVADDGEDHREGKDSEGNKGFRMDRLRLESCSGYCF
jgi:hypothetical protein